MIEKLSVIRMMEMDFEEILGHADEVSDYNEEVQRGLRRKAYAEGFEEGRKRGSEKQYFDKAMEDVGYILEEAAQEKRDRIVEQAKENIDGLKGEKHYEVQEPWRLIGPSLCYAKFLVNKDKSTVVALLKGINTKKIYKRGIAKCNPSDCFNVHIGKAIALRRALGVEVPDEYIHAPQPTEVRVGDIVKSRNASFPMIGSSKVVQIGNTISNKSCIVEKNNEIRQLKEVKIIDDSREDV